MPTSINTPAPSTFLVVARLLREHIDDAEGRCIAFERQCDELFSVIKPGVFATRGGAATSSTEHQRRDIIVAAARWWWKEVNG